jgi:hypothetical protein
MSFGCGSLHDMFVDSCLKRILFNVANTTCESLEETQRGKLLAFDALVHAFTTSELYLTFVYQVNIETIPLKYRLGCCFYSCDFGRKFNIYSPNRTSTPKILSTSASIHHTQACLAYPCRVRNTLPVSHI